MFKLNEECPNFILIDGVEHRVDLSFDNVITINEMLNDPELDDLTQILTGIKLLFVDPLEGDLKTQAEIFYRAYNELIGVGKEEVLLDLKGNPMPKAYSDDEDSKGPSYDLVQDAELIYASFFQYYGMDLHEHLGKLHYYKFRALLNGLGDDTIFQKIVEIRTKELPTGKGTSKQREALIKLKKRYALKKR